MTRPILYISGPYSSGNGRTVPADGTGGVDVTSGDASVTLDIGGLPVVLVLPERDVELMMWTYRANRILQEGRDDE